MSWFPRIAPLARRHASAARVALSLALITAAACADAGTATAPVAASVAAPAPHTSADGSTAPSVELQPWWGLSFGSQAVGTTSAPQTATLRNNGTVPLTLGAPYLVYIGFTIVSSACPVGPATLAPGASCTIAVAFAPTFAGTASGRVNIPTDATQGTVVVLLGGTGYVPTPALTVAPTAIGFGSVPLGLATSGRIIKITSTGTGPLVVSSVTLGGTNPGDFWLGNDGCSGVALLPGASCTVAVSFEPLRVGTRTATVTIAHNAAGGPSVVSLTGTGLRSGGYIP